MVSHTRQNVSTVVLKEILISYEIGQIGLKLLRAGRHSKEGGSVAQRLST